MAATTVNGGDGYEDQDLIEMRRQAAQLAQTGQRLAHQAGSVAGTVAATPRPQRQAVPKPVQSAPEAESVEVYESESVPVTVPTMPEPHPARERVQGYLQQQLATVAVFIGAACLFKKFPFIWDHRGGGMAVLLFAIALVLNAIGARQAQEVGDRLCTAAEMGERGYFYKHLQTLLYRRETRYLLLLEVAIGYLVADVVASAFFR